jgi:hypothetical protein
MSSLLINVLVRQRQSLMGESMYISKNFEDNSEMKGMQNTPIICEWLTSIFILSQRAFFYKFILLLRKYSK